MEYIGGIIVASICVATVLSIIKICRSQQEQEQQNIVLRDEQSNREESYVLLNIEEEQLTD
jgi:hypothetical protein